MDHHTDFTHAEIATTAAQRLGEGWSVEGLPFDETQISQPGGIQVTLAEVPGVDDPEIMITGHCGDDFTDQDSVIPGEGATLAAVAADVAAAITDMDRRFHGQFTGDHLQHLAHVLADALGQEWSSDDVTCCETNILHRSGIRLYLTIAPSHHRSDLAIDADLGVRENHMTPTIFVIVPDTTALTDIAAEVATAVPSRLAAALTELAACGAHPDPATGRLTPCRCDEEPTDQADRQH